MPSLTMPERTLSPMDASMCAYIGATTAHRSAMLREARGKYATHRASHGFGSHAAVLTSPAAQPKLKKSYVPTFGLTLVPASTILGVNLCPAASDGCRTACLFTSGKGAMSSVQRARLARATFAMLDPESFGILLASEIVRAINTHGRIRVRLNVVSDLRWELIIPRALALLSGMGATFYDYTKWAPKHRVAGLIHLTYSASERMTDDHIRAMVADGHNVAVVFAAPKDTVKRAAQSGHMWQGLRLVDGLSTDDRTTDPSGVVVALAALGRGVRDGSGFVREWVA